MAVTLHRLGVPLRDIRMDVVPTPAPNGVDDSFTTPDLFVHLGTNEMTIAVHLNGSRLTSPGDFTVSESGGAGTGFDTITLAVAPYTGDVLRVDYLKA